MALTLPPELIALVVFLTGVGLVVVSVETFVESVAESALALGVSGFFLTVVLAGTDVENAILGLAAAFGSLPDLALGTVFGEALFVLCAAVGLAGVLTPFETEVPRSYLVLTVVSPALFFALAFDGVLTRLDGAVLTGAFLPALGVVYLLERNRGTRYLSPKRSKKRSKRPTKALTRGPRPRGPARTTRTRAVSTAISDAPTRAPTVATARGWTPTIRTSTVSTPTPTARSTMGAARCASATRAGTNSGYRYLRWSA